MKKFYDRKNRRLLYIEEEASSDFWDNRWNRIDLRQTFDRGKNNRRVLSTLHRYIADKRGRILEGGCGLGQLVYCMHLHGYECVGIDFAEKSIQRTKEMFPELDLKVGDLRNLPFTDNYFRGYWSGGVIEHYWVGYHDILKEMRRVLIRGGYVFLSYPYMSFLRKLKAKFNLYSEIDSKNADKAKFYQFALNPKTVINNFKIAGFRLITCTPVGGIRGLMDEFNNHLLQRYYRYQGHNLFIIGSRFLFNKVFAPFCGHVIFCVFQKE
jgi:ubiquinone/menaquinone biosynthesis C-methylase UbiE